MVATKLPDGSRKQSRLALADDMVAADGANVFDHEQAKAAARAWVKTARTGELTQARLTVNDALDRYFAARGSDGMKSLDDSQRRAAFHIRPKLGTLAVDKLTVATLRAWRDGMVSAEKRLRTARYAERPNIQIVDLSNPQTQGHGQQDAVDLEGCFELGVQQSACRRRSRLATCETVSRDRRSAHSFSDTGSTAKADGGQQRRHTQPRCCCPCHGCAVWRVGTIAGG